MSPQNYASPPPPYRTNPPTFNTNPPVNNPQTSQSFNSTCWLLETQRQFMQPIHYRGLLCQIFHAPDHWWNEFLQICNLFLQPKFAHSSTSVWNFYTPSQIISMRSEYLTGGRRFTDTSGEVCNWLAFCIRDLRNSGIEWNSGEVVSSPEAQGGGNGGGSEEVRSGRRNETPSERRVRKEQDRLERSIGRIILGRNYLDI